ncbi:FAD/NAD(P)-binding domain-containing protein [Ramaria rubella]|nr:FAD/NAD(P)-binding domain-containing protein [Ramaria rubella]
MSNIEKVQTQSHVQVLVCGAGPVGLFTGIILASRGVHVHILEALPQINDSPRAVAYQPTVLSELIEADVYDDLRKVASESRGLTYWVGDGAHKKRLAVIPKAEGVTGIATGLNCGQPTFTQVLLTKLKTYPNSRVSFDSRVVDVHDDPLQGPARVVYETSKGEKVHETCDWLIGADGSRSTVRKLLGIEFEGFTWPKEEFVATNVLYPFTDFGYTSGNFLIHPIHWAVIASIDDSKNLWRIAYGTRPGMTLDEIKAEIPKRFEQFLPDPNIKYDLLQVSPYRVHQRCATQLRKGRVLLAGDAAHSNNPIGGLGLTSGLLDAGPLARALVAVIYKRAPDGLLDKWATFRHKLFWEYTNPQSIENKRIIQQGGYGEDQAHIWTHDKIAESLGMVKWLQNATLQAKERDEAMFKAMLDEDNRLRMRAHTWTVAMPVDWMAEYEDPEILAARRANRPRFDY